MKVIRQYKEIGLIYYDTIIHIIKDGGYSYT